METKSFLAGMAVMLLAIGIGSAIADSSSSSTSSDESLGDTMTIAPEDWSYFVQERMFVIGKAQIYAVRYHDPLALETIAECARPIADDYDFMLGMPTSP